MSYITLVEADLQSALTGPELNAVKTAALAAGQTGVVAEILSQVTTEVRARVAACAKNTLGESGTIPDECKSAAVDIAVYRIAKRLPGKVVLTDERNNANDNAIAFMRDVAKCDVAIVPPSTPAPGAEQAAGGNSVQLVSSTPRRATRAKLDGL